MVRMRCRIAEEEEPASAQAKLHATLEEHILDPEERDFLKPRLAHLLGLAEHHARDQHDPSACPPRPSSRASSRRSKRRSHRASRRRSRSCWRPSRPFRPAPGNRTSTQARRFRARLAGADAADDDAYAAAATRFRQLGIVFWLAVTQLEHGEWLVGQGR
ncbi:MAG TPA: hypothetical protein VJK66_04535, partial [Gaiellaceae bacterium]|nr:hypothetical protein [Gaiellaceae bacterium]